MSGQNWQRLSPNGMAMGGSPVQGSMPGLTSVIPMRDPLDAMRAQIGARVPSAEWPDGYLGTIQSRREDRLLDSLNTRSTQRSYERGVHKGERIDPADYFWPIEMQPDAGLRRQAAGVIQPDHSVASPRYAPVGTILEQMQAHADQLPTTPNGKMRPLIPEGAPDEVRRQALAALLPDWRTA